MLNPISQSGSPHSVLRTQIGFRNILSSVSFFDSQYVVLIGPEYVPGLSARGWWCRIPAQSPTKMRNGPSSSSVLEDWLVSWGGYARRQRRASPAYIPGESWPYVK